MFVSKSKEQVREEAKSDVAEFLKTGGTVQVVEPKKLSRKLQRRWMSK